MGEFGFPQALPTPDGGENRACIALATTDCTSKRLDIRLLHFVRDAHTDGIIRIFYEPSSSVLADIFLKLVNNPQFEALATEW